MIEMRWIKIGLEDSPAFGDVFNPPDVWLRLQYREADERVNVDIVKIGSDWKNIPVEMHPELLTGGE